MPNIKSVVKDVKKSRENHLRNIATKSRIKTLVKKTRAAAENNDAEAGKLLVETVSTVDRAVKRGIIHKNAAARRKSRLMKSVNKPA
ncbi:MAG: 30S ribosomal protein S20 [Armatimonadota bacterium]|nr:30S ribosomal protein S20 [Armatimonadota bacterium]